MNFDGLTPGEPQYLTKASIPPLEEWVSCVIGLEPVYLELYGNATRIYCKDGFTMAIGKSAHQVVNDIARYYYICLTALRKAFEREIGKSQYRPLVVLASHLVYSPFKCRVKPQSKNDGVTGYFNPAYIDRYQPHRDGTTDLILKTGHKVRVHMTQSLITKRIQEGKQFFVLLKHRHTLDDTMPGNNFDDFTPQR